MTGNENRAIPADSLLAKSLCGHDKGKVFLVIREEGDCCYLADGVLDLDAYSKALYAQTGIDLRLVSRR